MATPWTPERRAKQAALIGTWKPWERSTGPRSPDGKAKASRNAFKGGERPQLRQMMRTFRELDKRRKERDREIDEMYEQYS